MNSAVARRRVRAASRFPLQLDFLSCPIPDREIQFQEKWLLEQVSPDRQVIDTLCFVDFLVGWQQFTAEVLQNFRCDSSDRTEELLLRRDTITAIFSGENAARIFLAYHNLTVRQAEGDRSIDEPAIPMWLRMLI
jgi:hypothetical protein